MPWAIGQLTTNRLHLVPSNDSSAVEPCLLRRTASATTPDVQTHGLYIAPHSCFDLLTLLHNHTFPTFHCSKTLTLGTITSSTWSRSTILLLAGQMALDLYIPPCIRNPPHPHHPPPIEKPLRISIEGPLSSVNKLLPGIEWQLKRFRPPLQAAAPELAKLAFRTLYGQEIPATIVDNLVVRDEYLGWVQEDPEPWE